MKQQIIGILVGSVVINLKGANKERFLNALAHHDITVFEKESHADESCFTIEIYEYDLEVLSSLSKKYLVKIISVQKKGVPTLIRYYGKRIGFWIGAIGCLVFLMVMSRCIWDFECIGESYHTEEAIMKFLKTRNIHYGSFYSKIDLKKEALIFRKNNNDIAWCDFSIDGCSLVITLRESDPISKTHAAEKGVSIVAPQAGRIVSIITRFGTPVVKAKDKVKKGDVLIHGYLVYKNDGDEIVGYKACIADGDIYGTYKKKINLKIKKKMPSEEILYCKKGLAITHDGKILGIYHKINNKDTIHGVLREYKEIPIFNKVLGRTYILDEKYYEYDKKEKIISKKEAQAYFENKLEKLTKKIEENKGKILEKKLELDNNSREILLSGVLYIKGPFIKLKKTEIPSLGKESE